MKLKSIYLILSILGLILPYAYFVPWVAENGLDLPLFFRQLFANPIGAFFGVDVFVSAVALIVFVASESSRLQIRTWWLPLLAVVTVGVSLGLPLFLYLRESEVGARSLAPGAPNSTMHSS